MLPRSLINEHPHRAPQPPKANEPAPLQVRVGGGIRGGVGDMFNRFHCDEDIAGVV